MKRVWLGFFLLVGISLLLFSLSEASEMVFTFINPAFGGNPLNGQWLLNSAQAQNTFKEKSSLPSLHLPKIHLPSTPSSPKSSQAEKEGSLLFEDQNLIVGEMNIYIIQEGTGNFLEVGQPW